MYVNCRTRKTIGAVVALLVVSSTQLEAVEAGGAADPVNRAYRVILDDARPASPTSFAIPADAFSSAPSEKAAAAATTQPDKIGPLVREWMATRRPDDRERLVVNFADDVEIPRFPEPVAGEPRDSEANLDARRRAEELVAGIKQRRADSYAGLSRELEATYGARVLGTYWLIKGALIDMPLGRVGDLARRSDVLFVAPKRTNDPAPDSNPDNDVVDGRKRIASDPYVVSGYGGITLLTGVGLLDTGVRFSHDLLNLQSSYEGDCVNGGDDCLTGTLKLGDECDHGTSSAAIIVGDQTMGNEYRGVAPKGYLDSWRVYPGPPDKEGVCYLDTDAAVLAFQVAVKNLNRVIVAEMQAQESYAGPISWVANKAFDAGAVVVAANGNKGPGAGTARAPAIANKVIGVGGYHVDTLAQYANQSRGPTSDLRIKPDVQAPTYSETASSASDSALQVFGGTSGSTPYAGGAAVVMRNWMVQTLHLYDPGQVYAQLILSGQHPYPFDNTEGAGRMRLPTKGVILLGKVAVKDQQQVDVTFDLSGTAFDAENARLDAALWWPEFGNQFKHSEIHVRLLDPKGTVRASSAEQYSVFQRAQAKGNLTPGTWTVRVTGKNVPIAPQEVYFVAFATQQ